MSAWSELVRRYADGRPICNCGHAYYSPCGRGIDREGRQRTDMLACQYGCSSNQIDAKEKIASRVLRELNATAPEKTVEPRRPSPIRYESDLMLEDALATKCACGHLKTSHRQSPHGFCSACGCGGFEAPQRTPATAPGQAAEGQPKGGDDTARTGSSPRLRGAPQVASPAGSAETEPAGEQRRSWDRDDDRCAVCLQPGECGGSNCMCDCHREPQRTEAAPPKRIPAPGNRCTECGEPLALECRSCSARYETTDPGEELWLLQALEQQVRTEFLFEGGILNRLCAQLDALRAAGEGRS